jgi:hypothetical protein
MGLMIHFFMSRYHGFFFSAALAHGLPLERVKGRIRHGRHIHGHRFVWQHRV